LLQQHCKLEVEEHFVKQTIRSRCQIAGANNILTLRIPKVRKNSSKTLVKDLRINNDTAWQKQHWNSIVSAYNSSPFFEYYQDDIAPLYEEKPKFLLDWNNKTQELLGSLLNLEISLPQTDSYQKNTEGLDLRSYTFDKQTLPTYTQVFSEKYGFTPNLSILDLLFNEGPNTETYLQALSLK
ncbi:MAG: WbqC family protein, partial [Bacteroidetes bacterium]|nr:WbqC family protein [Bacteroidota bacterium]